MIAKQTERGQVLVIIILVIVGMMGFAALAIDGGQLYAERRRAQNAADSAAYKIAYEAVHNSSLTHAEMEAMARELITTNGFTQDLAALPEDQAVKIEVHYPPASGVYDGNGEYYQVFITTNVQQSFSQFVFSGSQNLTVEAIAHARPYTSITPGDALYANDKSASPALEFAGNGKTSITGGDAFSNSAAEVSGKQNGSGSVTIAPPYSLEVAGYFTETGFDPEKDQVEKSHVSPQPLDRDDGIVQQQLPAVPTPDCTTDMPSRSVPASGNVLLPGRYGSEVKISSGNWKMDPGMYCFMNGFRFNGGDLYGKDVFIYIKQGGLSITGGGSVELHRPNDLRDGAGNPSGKGNQWGGMLFYVAGGDIDLLGGASTLYTGTIYAPKSQCEIGGNAGALGIRSNIICNTVKIHGTADVVINYREPQNFRLPPIIELAQ